MLSIKEIKANEILKGFAWLLALIVALYALNGYIEGIVVRKIGDPEIIEKVKAQIRPMVVFDQNESILVDTGGMQYIENIHVMLDKKKETPQEIIVTPKIYLAIAPILESFDADFVITSERGRQFQWIYKLGAIQRLALVESATRKGANRFRLEIIK
jgi:hypothetical protein